MAGQWRRTRPAGGNFAAVRALDVLSEPADHDDPVCGIRHIPDCTRGSPDEFHDLRIARFQRRWIDAIPKTLLGPYGAVLSGFQLDDAAEELGLQSGVVHRRELHRISEVLFPDKHVTHIAGGKLDAGMADDVAISRRR